MNDCQNAEMRDQLPDLLNERLEARARDVLMAHVDGCVDCRAEMELLRVARGALLKATPRVDLNYIVEALPKAAPRTHTASIPRRRVWSDWRVAAAAVLLIAGGSSYSLLGRRGGIAVRDTLVAQLPPTTSPELVASGAPKPDSNPSAKARAPQPDAVVADGAEASEGGTLGGSRLTDLNESQLKSLLTEIDQLQATPITEPDPVTIRVNTKGGSSPEAF